jgi:hypothetical protein
MKILKKKNHFGHQVKHSDLRHSKNYAKIKRNREIGIHRKMRKFEHEQSVKKRKLKKLEAEKRRHEKHEQELIKKKKERRNLDELKKRMARRGKGKALHSNVYPIAKTPHLVSQKKHASVHTRFLKSKKVPVKETQEDNHVQIKGETISPEQKPRDLDDDVKLSDHSGLKIPTKAKIYATAKSAELKTVNPNSIKIDRKLLEVGVSDYADFSPKNQYLSQQACQMQQKQATVIAREIVTQQSKRLYEKLTNYLLKGKLLVNMTKQKVNKALAGKLKEMLKPGHVGFTMEDIDDVEHQIHNPMDEDLSEAEDYVTKETYSDFKGFDEGMPNDDQIKWNLN